MAAPEVHNDTDQQQYSLVEDGEVIGFAAYELDDDEIRFVHTEVDPSHRGGGHASILVERALDDVRSGSTRRVVAQCSYVHAWIERHPDYQELTTR
ncbi:GNAT family N-acetyltransferase [Curtobacterium sp. ISL-83]|uniref:GNAT family N-acetyltransferase n=1 Tax=Curtobacterium sp. ISL-83 TaxID=2819145 RepID=UPI001BE71767|nr:GNAT family N-acetyltransferase [Curtobacterium sp. ISL-83]MBT2502812.1 N-acetyltransferase [Curtobacterium sp. ISL-83]